MIGKKLRIFLAMWSIVLAVGSVQAQSSIGEALQNTVVPVINLKELNCLARNIFYEAGSESELGKAAVGVVTLNRKEDGRFGNSICAVVHQRAVFERIYQVAQTQMVKLHWWSSPQPVTTVHTETRNHAVCQFSWSCRPVSEPKSTDQRWQQSRRVAQDLLTTDQYNDLKDRYSDALYFHAAGAHAEWTHDKRQVGRIGGQVFYKEK